MGAQKLLRGHDASASLRHRQMAPATKADSLQLWVLGYVWDSVECFGRRTPLRITTIPNIQDLFTAHDWTELRFADCGVNACSELNFSPAEFLSCTVNTALYAKKANVKFCLLDDIYKYTGQSDVADRRRNFLYSAQHSHNVVARNLATAML